MSKESALAVATPAAIPIPTEGSSENSPSTSITSTPTIDAQRLAKQARREAEIQAKREQFKREQQEFQSTKQRADEILKKAQEFETTRTKDPVQALKMLGFNEAEIINFLTANDPVEKTPEQKAAEAAQAEIKKFQEDQEKKQQEQVKAQHKQVIDNFKKNITTTIAKNAEKYEFCAYEGTAAEELIFETVSACLAEDRKTNPNAEAISIEEAAQMVEDFYEQDYKEKSGKLKKLKPADPPKTEEPVKAPIQSPRTLSNRVTATVASTATKAETPSQRRERLIKQIKEHGLTK